MVVQVRLQVIIRLRFPISIGLFSVVDGLTFSWLLFLHTSSCGVCTLYERGVLAVVTVLPVVWCLSKHLCHLGLLVTLKRSGDYHGVTSRGSGLYH